MDWWQVIILGIVEGVTEFLPISSTGHLVLVSKLLAISQTDFVKSFEIGIQLGAIAAVAGIYAKRFLNDRETIKKVIAAFVPTGVLGFILYKLVKQYLLGNVWVTVIALGVGGGLMIVMENKFQKLQTLEIKDLNYKKSVIIGLVQAISMIPGVSRAAATILGGMGVGLTRQAATEFSFLLAVPTMMAATGLDLVKSGTNFNGGEWGMLAGGFGVALVVAWITVKWLIKYVQKHTLRGFGVYRIILAVVYALIFYR